MTDLTTPGIAARSKQRRSLTAGFEPNARTFAGEHALLLRDVRRRTTPLAVLIETGTWPAAELRTLIRFLRSVVLRQIAGEGRLLFPGDSTEAPFAELTMDQVRLHSITEHLDQVSANPCALPELTALIEELLATLERHVAAEEAVFEASPGMPDEVPGAAEVAAGNVRVVSPAGDTVVLLEALPVWLFN